MTFFSLALTLFLILDPIGNIPIFANVLSKYEPMKQKKIILREMIISLGILILFEYIGAWVLNLLNVGITTVKIQGGIILFLIALGMIFPTLDTCTAPQDPSLEPLVVPLAVPLIAGPTILATIMVYSKQVHSHTEMIVAITLAWAVSTLILVLTPLLKKILKDRFMTACTRLMGLVLTFISIQMLLEGIAGFIKIH